MIWSLGKEYKSECAVIGLFHGTFLFRNSKKWTMECKIKQVSQEMSYGM